MEARPDGDARYAIYLAPAPETDLWRRASGWLGRDAATDAAVAWQGPAGLDPRRAAEITADARHYGFHATLKAPFRLRAGTTAADLCAAARAFAGRQQGFPLRLRLSAVGSFLALVEAEPVDAVARLHAAVLQEFEPFRAAPRAAEVARRLQAGLSARQKESLAEWGYPYVLDDFRLHYTLTSALPPAERRTVEAALASFFAADIAAPVMIDAICVFAQPAATAPFHILYRAPFAPSR